MIITYVAYNRVCNISTNSYRYHELIYWFKNIKSPKITCIHICENGVCGYMRRFADEFNYSGATLCTTTWNDDVKYLVDAAESRGMRIRMSIDIGMHRGAAKYIMRPGWYRRICGFTAHRGRRYVVDYDMILCVGIPDIGFPQTVIRRYIDILNCECNDYNVDAIYFTKNTDLFNCITFNGLQLMLGSREYRECVQLPFKVWLLHNHGLPKFIVVKILLHMANLIWFENKLLFNL